MKNNHHSVETYTGEFVDLKRLDPSLLSIVDMAYSLAKICRYTGHCSDFYSVAEHCVLGSRLIAPKFRLAFLLHDNIESYFGDVNRPLKTLLPNYRKYERTGAAVIYKKFYGRLMTKGEEAEVHLMDNRMLLREAYDLMPSQGRNWKASWTGDIEMANIEIECWDWRKAAREYLKAWRQLTEFAK